MATSYCWLVENGDTTAKYRTMDQMGIQWTDDPQKAIRFARRADAEMFAAGDEDAWSIVEHGFENDSIASTPRTDCDYVCRSCGSHNVMPWPRVSSQSDAAAEPPA